MFSLHINNSEIYLPEDFNFGMVLESPLFNRRGNYSYPFKVPYEPNKHFFGNLKELSSVEPELPISFEIKWNDITKLAGEVSKFKYANQEIKLTLVGAKSLFYKKVFGLYLDEMDMGSKDYSGNSEDEVLLDWADSCRYSKDETGFPTYTNRPFVFAPMYAENFYPENSWLKTDFPSPYINQWDPVTNHLLPDTIHVCNIYFLYVLEKIIDYTGYSINRNDLLKAGDGLFNRINIDIRRLYFQSWVHIQPHEVAGSSMEYRYFLPHKMVSELLDELSIWIGLSIVPNDINKTVALVLLKEAIRDDRIESRLNRSVLLGNRERETFVKTGIARKYNLEGDEFENNLTTIQPGVVYGYVNEYKDLPLITDILLGKIYKVNYTNRLYRASENSIDEKEWQLVGEFAPIEIGDSPTKTETKINTHLTRLVNIGVDTGIIEASIYLRDAQRPFGYITQSAIDTYVAQHGGGTYIEYADIELPFSSSEGISFQDLKNRITPKPDNGLTFLIYQGVKKYNANTNQYPVDFYFPKSSYDKWPIRGNEADGWLSLKWLAGEDTIEYGRSDDGWLYITTTSAYGLYKNYLALPINWEINHKRLVSFYIDVPPGEVFNLDFLLKYQMDDLSFHINKIHLNFKRKLISSVRLECYYATGGIAELPQHFLMIDDEHYLLIDEINKLLID